MKRHANSRTDALHTSWDQNAQLWTAAVRESTIATRAAGTDRAIVDAVTRYKPRSVIDIGCGEGWLVRRLSREHDCRVVGVDGSARLIDVQEIERAGMQLTALEEPPDASSAKPLSLVMVLQAN